MTAPHGFSPKGTVYFFDFEKLHWGSAKKWIRKSPLKLYRICYPEDQLLNVNTFNRSDLKSGLRVQREESGRRYRRKLRCKNGWKVVATYIPQDSGEPFALIPESPQSCLALEVGKKKQTSQYFACEPHPLPSLNENLVGSNHRLITEPSLPGQQTNLAFPQAGSAFLPPPTMPGLKDPSSRAAKYVSPPIATRSWTSAKARTPGRGENPIAERTEQENWEQRERVEVANFSTPLPLWLKQWQTIYHTFWLHASWLFKKKKERVVY